MVTVHGRPRVEHVLALSRRRARAGFQHSNPLTVEKVSMWFLWSGSGLLTYSIKTVLS